jgi:hypothetical protein
LRNSVERGVDRVEVLNAEARPLAFVPERGFFKFGGGFGL